MNEKDRSLFGNSKWSTILRVVVLLTIITYPFVHKYSLVFNVGESMSPTHGDKEILLVLDLDSYTPNRYDVVVVRLTSEQWTKRVIGLPGESIGIINGRIFIDGSELKDEFGNGNIVMELEGLSPELINMEPQIVPSGHVWVIGDNRRISDFSYFPFSDIIGKVVF